MPRPVVLIRQVPGASQPKFAPKIAKPSKPHPGVSPKNASHGPLIIRRVVDAAPVVRHSQSDAEEQEEATKKFAELKDHDKLPTQDVATDRQPTPGSLTLAHVQITPPSSPLRDDPPVSFRPQDNITSGGTTIPSSPAPDKAKRPSNVRRTSRLRKPTQTIAADVFGATDIRPSHRRKAPTSRPEAFPGMSAVALKALTSSNTVRNQQYLVAKLETEVIRKEGARPESPSVKVRTISQRELEEKGKQRQERAERRARRSDDGTSDIEGDSSLMETEVILEHDGQGAIEIPLKHRRGPGDEEDYKTPDKMERAEKRMRIGESEEAREKKRVKWDRGLSTAIYLDELQPGTRKRLQENAIKKGCLAGTAKVRGFNCVVIR
jgi:hypothetical protein